MDGTDSMYVWTVVWFFLNFVSFFAVLGCGPFSSCSERGPSPSRCTGFLVVVASVEEHRL